MLKCTSCMFQRTLSQKIVLQTLLRTSSQLNTEKPAEKKSLDVLKPQRVIPRTPPGYTLVFKFPYIRPLAIINRLKIYQTILSGLSLSGALLLRDFEYISTDAVYITAALGISGCMTLYGLGFFTRNIVGHIYYNPETNSAIVAYVDYWGRRQDLELPVQDIVPLEEITVSKFNLFWLKFRRYSTKETLRINVKHAIILHKEGFNRVM